MKISVKVVIAMLALLPVLAQAVVLVWPENRSVYYADEAIKMAFNGIEAEEDLYLAISEVKNANRRFVDASIPKDATFVSFKPYSFAPGVYDVSVYAPGGGLQKLGQMTVASGIHQSTMLVSQTANGWSNFAVSNAFSFGLLDGNGEPVKDVRGKKSGTMKSYEDNLARNMPLLCYMYWTGYVTHKPWGASKSWGNEEMMDAMRLLNFSTAERLKRYDKLFFAIGSLDEPGLSWGETPAGGMASGFPNKDEKAWYEKYGIKYTQDIANVSDAEWMNYIRVRNYIMGYNFEQAAHDIKTAWPTAVYSTDGYALHAIMDGTDALNQLPNDVPSSHVFFDWWGGPMNVAGQVQAEKAMRPYDRLAHAMNGQLDGVRSDQTKLYYMLMNNMLQGGLYSNWWLNTGGMTEATLEQVNRPAAEMGPMFKETNLNSYDIAIMHGFTELAMSQKEMARLESNKKGGEQIKLMLPIIEGNDASQFEFDSNAYEIGPNYQVPVFVMQQVFRRAGYPSQLIDERLIPLGYLNNYKVLAIFGQTFEMPKNVMDGIAAFIKKGGVVLVDESTTVYIPDAIKMTGVNTKDMTRKLSAEIAKNKASITDKDNKKNLSYIDTMFASWNPMFKSYVEPVKSALANTKAAAYILTYDHNLAVDSQSTGEGKLISVINAFEMLPTDDELMKGVAEGTLLKSLQYPKYNYAEYNAYFSLTNIKDTDVVYVIDGLDWKRAYRLYNPKVTYLYQFAPAEMKLFLVVPREITRINVKGTVKDGLLSVESSIPVKTAFPITITIFDPLGNQLYKVERSMNTQGSYKESFPIGAFYQVNAENESYTVTVTSIINNLSSSANIKRPKGKVEALAASKDNVLIVEPTKVSNLMKNKSSKSFVIAYANDEQKDIASSFVLNLRNKGIDIVAKPENEAISNVKYPRVWNPTVDVYSVSGDISVDGDLPSATTKLSDKGYIYVDATGKTVKVEHDGFVFVDAEGKNVKHPKMLLTVGNEGFVMYQNRDSEACFNSGVILEMSPNGSFNVLNATAKKEEVTQSFRDKWSTENWTLTSYFGGLQLPPQLPEAYTANTHLIVLGDSYTNEIMCILQASELLPQIVDNLYPGKGKALIQYLYSPFGIECDVITVGATDNDGIKAGLEAIQKLVK